MTGLPVEILAAEVFARLDPPDLARCSLVCKTWKAISESSWLWKRFCDRWGWHQDGENLNGNNGNYKKIVAQKYPSWKWYHKFLLEGRALLLESTLSESPIPWTKVYETEAQKHEICNMKKDGQGRGLLSVRITSKMKVDSDLLFSTLSDYFRRTYWDQNLVDIQLLGTLSKNFEVIKLVYGGIKVPMLISIDQEGESKLFIGFFPFPSFLCYYFPSFIDFVNGEKNTVYYIMPFLDMFRQHQDIF